MEPFDASYAPGPKHLDFDIDEISITKARAKEVDFSVPYLQAPQAIVVNKGSQYAAAGGRQAMSGHAQRAKAGARTCRSTISTPHTLIVTKSPPVLSFVTFCTRA